MRNLLKVGMGVMVGRCLMMAAMPVLARLYSPAHFGALAVYASVLGPLAIVASLRLEQAIPVAREEWEAVNVLMAGALVMAGVVALTFLGLLVLIPLVPRFIPPGESWLFRILVPFGMLAAGSVQLLNAWAIRMGNFRSIARTKIYQGASQAITGIAGGLLLPTPAMLILSDIAGRAAGTGTFLKLFLATARHSLRLVSWARIRDALIRFKDFPRIAAGSALLNALGTAVPALALSILYSKESAGWYAMAAQGLSAPLLLAGQAAGQVYVSHAAALVRADPAALTGFFRRTALRLLLWGTGPILLLGLLGPIAFPRILGAQWGVSGRFVRIMIPLYLLDFGFSPVSQTLLLLERQGAQLFWDVTRVTVVTGGFVLGHASGLDPAGALKLYTLLLSVIYVIGFLLCDWHCRRSQNPGTGPSSSP
jgi:O-antigen/teichoic acid export membrane protein